VVHGGGAPWRCVRAPRKLAPMRALSSRGLLLLLLALALACTWSARGLPLVRNSLVYARASENVIAAGYDPRPVVTDSRQSYDKPILYAWASAPLVRLLGNHDGLRASSFLTSAAFLLALLHFARSFRALLPERGERAFLWLAAFGPCVVYQFWSAHPDGWFAALAVLAWSQTHRLVTRPEAPPVRGMLALGATLLVAILLKNYGLVLLLSCPAYFLWHLGRLRAEPRAARLLVSGLAVLALLGLFVAAAWSGHNPLSRLEGEGGGVGQYATGELWRSARGAWVALALALGLHFQAALVFALRRAAFGRELLAPLACFGAPYVLGLMPFPTTFYNMRYFQPLFALAALVLVRGAGGFRAARARVLWCAHGLTGAVLVLVFNSAPLFRRVEPWIPRLEVDWIGVPLSLLDNLRMRLHLEQQEFLGALDAAVPDGARLYLLDVNYYGDAQRGVYERAGLIRAEIHTSYAAARDFAPEEAEFYVYSARPVELGALGEVSDLGHGLWRVRRG
jgi:hypothetical protein